MYANGEVPLSLLVARPCADKDVCLMMPGTAAKFDKLVALAQAERDWTPVVSGSSDAYRTLGMQWSYWNTLPYPQAAYPSTSSHGGTYNGVESGALDIGNWGQVGQDVFFDLARRAGFEPGYFDGTGGKPLEQWHIIDWSPWDAPAPTPSTAPAIPSEEDDMYAIRQAGLPDSGIIIRAGVPPYSLPAQVFETEASSYGLTIKDLPDWRYGTAVREHWTAFNTAQQFAKGMSQSDIDKIAAATRDALGGTVTPPKA